MTDSLFSPASLLYFVNKYIQYGPSLENLVAFPICLVIFMESKVLFSCLNTLSLNPILSLTQGLSEPSPLKIGFNIILPYRLMCLFFSF
jgi:hypothetical protein